MTTSSIPKPESRLARVEPATEARTEEKVKPQSLRTTEKVRMRKDASTSSPVVTMVKGGQTVSVVATDGQWRKVSVGAQTGWIRSDYLSADTDRPVIEAAIPRPKADVGATSSQPQTTTASAAPGDMSDWGALRPARAPQGGDCQCPYDLMLNGKQCGPRSAYAKGRETACYF